MTSAQPPQDGNGEGVVNLFAGTEGIYNLPHHAKEIERLRNQHAFLLSATGGAMLLAPIKQRSVKVLDCGAADGKAKPELDGVLSRVPSLGRYLYL
jgi:hypothetical protein